MPGGVGGDRPGSLAAPIPIEIQKVVSLEITAAVRSVSQDLLHSTPGRPNVTYSRPAVLHPRQLLFKVKS